MIQSVPFNPIVNSSAMKAASLMASTVQSSNLTYIPAAAPRLPMPIVQTQQVPISRIHKIENNPLPMPVLPQLPLQMPVVDQRRRFPQYGPIARQKKNSSCWSKYWLIFLFLALLAVGLALLFGLMALNNNKNKPVNAPASANQIDPIDANTDNPASNKITPQIISNNNAVPPKPTHFMRKNQVDPVTVQPITSIDDDKPTAPKVYVPSATVNPIPVQLAPSTKVPVTPESVQSTRVYPTTKVSSQTDDNQRQQVQIPAIESLPQKTHAKSRVSSVDEY